jgi:hypothetical protein
MADIERLLFEAYRIIDNLDGIAMSAGTYDVCGDDTHDQVEVDEWLKEMRNANLNIEKDNET